MKKIFAITLIASLLVFPSFALAGDEDSKVVGEDITIGEDEMKIVSVEDEAEYDESIAYVGLPVDTQADDGVPVVGEDIVIGEGEAKIVSVDEGFDEAD